MPASRMLHKYMYMYVHVLLCVRVQVMYVRTRLSVRCKIIVQGHSCNLSCIIICSARFSLGRVRVEDFCRSETQQQDIPFMILTFPEMLIGAMQSVKHTHYSIHLVEPKKGKLWG